MYLGIDIGASFCKAVLVESGNEISKTFTAPMPNFLDRRPGSKLKREISIKKIIKVIVKVVRSVINGLHGEIDGIGITGQMHGILLVGESNQPLTDFISWQDERTIMPFPNGTNQSYLKFIKENLCEYRTLTGIDIRSGMLGPVLFWLKNNRELPNMRFVKASFLPDYIAALLTGTDPVCDPTNAAGSGVFDLQRGSWLDPYIRLTGISEDVLPRVVPSGTVVGETNRWTSQLIGIREGVPVFVSMGDYHAALFASALDAESLSFNIGTGAQVSILTKDPKYSADIETRPFFDGYSINCISGLPGGRAISLFADFIFSTVALFSSPPEKQDIILKLESLGLEQFDRTAVVCDPRFYNPRNETDANPGFFHLNDLNFNPVDLFYALLEGMLHQYFKAFGLICPYKKVDDFQIVLSGGVARKSMLLQKIMNSNYGLRFRLSGYAEEAAAGAALIAKKYH